MLEQGDEIGERFMKGQHVGVLGSLKRRCMPSSRACVVSCAMMSCDRQVKTVAARANRGLSHGAGK